MSTILILIVLVGIVISINRRLPPSACTHDCNEGRNCTCKEKKDGI
jgi:hypothetical protein